VGNINTTFGWRVFTDFTSQSSQEEAGAAAENFKDLIEEQTKEFI